MPLYGPYPQEEAINEPDPDMTHLEIVCVYPDEPGFASPPFYIGSNPNPYQIYAFEVKKIQDIFVDLGTTTIYRNGSWVTEPYFTTLITGTHPTDAWDVKDAYFPPNCLNQNISETLISHLEGERWDSLIGWYTSTAELDGVLVVLRDSEGEFWPQPQNYQDMNLLGNLEYKAGDCDDWAGPNPREEDKILTIKTPRVFGEEPYYDCNQYQYFFYGVHYQPADLRPPSIVPTVGLGLALILLGVTGTVGVAGGGGGGKAK